MIILTFHTSVIYDDSILDMCALLLFMFFLNGQNSTKWVQQGFGIEGGFFSVLKVGDFCCHDGYNLTAVNLSLCTDRVSEYAGGLGTRAVFEEQNNRCYSVGVGCCPRSS